MSDREVLSARLGSVGFWTFQLDGLDASAAREAASQVEEMGYGAIWIPEGFGSKEAFSHSALLLEATRSIVVATGIANVWARDPMAMASGGKVLADAYPERFLLGIGVSHAVRAEGRGHTYSRPLTKMRSYLADMDSADGPELPAAPRVLAALGPRMLELSRDASMGAHPYFVPVEHTVQAREILGPDRFLAPEQLVVLDTDPAVARSVGREFMANYLALPNYANNLRRLGWGEDDLADPSDAFVDALVAWGDVDAVCARIQEHLDAGADHVCLQVVRPDDAYPADELRELAPAIRERFARQEGRIS